MSDISTAMVDRVHSLKALDPKRPIREADIDSHRLLGIEPRTFDFIAKKTVGASQEKEAPTRQEVGGLNAAYLLAELAALRGLRQGLSTCPWLTGWIR